MYWTILKCDLITQKCLDYLDLTLIGNGVTKNIKEACVSLMEWKKLLSQSAEWRNAQLSKLVSTLLIITNFVSGIVLGQYYKQNEKWMYFQ